MLLSSKNCTRIVFDLEFGSKIKTFYSCSYHEFLPGQVLKLKNMLLLQILCNQCAFNYATRNHVPDLQIMILNRKALKLFFFYDYNHNSNFKVFKPKRKANGCTNIFVIFSFRRIFK